MKCQAIIEAFNESGVRSYSMQRITIPVRRACKRDAKAKVGSLCLCSQHASLAELGLIDSDGTVAPRPDIRIVRAYPKKFPKGLYSWASGLKIGPLTSS